MLKPLDAPGNDALMVEVNGMSAESSNANGANCTALIGVQCRRQAGEQHRRRRWFSERDRTGAASVTPWRSISSVIALFMTQVSAAEEPKAGVCTEVLATAAISLPFGFLKRAIWPLRSNQLSLAGASVQGQLDFLLGGRTSASAERQHWSGRAVRWSSRATLL